MSGFSSIPASSAIVPVVPTPGGGPVTPGSSGTIYTNEGAAGPTIFSLPAATKGLNYEFAVVAAQNMRILCNGADVIAFGQQATSGAGGYAESALPNSLLRIVCVKTAGVTWNVDILVGAWNIV